MLFELAPVPVPPRFPVIVRFRFAVLVPLDVVRDVDRDAVDDVRRVEPLLLRKGLALSPRPINELLLAARPTKFDWSSEPKPGKVGISLALDTTSLCSQLEPEIAASEDVGLLVVCAWAVGKQSKSDPVNIVNKPNIRIFVIKLGCVFESKLEILRVFSASRFSYIYQTLKTSFVIDFS